MAPLIRILLRYVAAALVTKGVIDQSLATEITTDPEVFQSFEIALGAVMAALNEAWYMLAKRKGWTT